MTERTTSPDRRWFLAALLGAILAVACAAGLLVGCAPKADGGNAGADAPAAQATDEAEDNPLAGQPVNWTMESDCATCHTTEAASATDAACPQDVAHEAEGLTCVQCHTDEAVLSTAHAEVTYDDKPASKATVATVDPATCIACHGDMDEVAKLTADSTALTDDKGTTVNPHERPAGERHDEVPATCTDCHNNHSKDLPKDAMKYCAQCHHRGTFECGTCHELRERSVS
ncbi:cytochrome c3 family protein [uncultured Adlercreutzia sp.]|uniref:cytochrome c3 family protein n=1 Tax=uncultured Adlercreutzia sp. TaxID=875803 RepID=UPI0025ED973A|nr:cytochrome c3 family protein [uncultured Adlercreutzia sp.]